MIWVLKLFWSAFTGDLFKFYTVLPRLAGAAGFWSTGSSTPEGDTPGATSPMIDGGTVDSPPTTVNTVQVFPDVEFTYTYWLYGRKQFSADDENHPFYYLKLDPVIKGAKLSADEYVMPADHVAMLGNGSSDAGAKKLDAFTKEMRMKAFGTAEQQKPINATKELKDMV